MTHTLRGESVFRNFERLTTPQNNFYHRIVRDLISDTKTTLDSTIRTSHMQFSIAKTHTHTHTTRSRKRRGHPSGATGAARNPLIVQWVCGIGRDNRFANCTGPQIYQHSCQNYARFFFNSNFAHISHHDRTLAMIDGENSIGVEWCKWPVILSGKNNSILILSTVVDLYKCLLLYFIFCKKKKKSANIFTFVLYSNSAE